MFVSDALTNPAHARFALKVQQFTGPMMAKSLEDTAFYRYHRLIALNEVGGNPAAGSPARTGFLLPSPRGERVG